MLYFKSGNWFGNHWQLILTNGSTGRQIATEINHLGNVKGIYEFPDGSACPWGMLPCNRDGFLL